MPHHLSTQRTLEYSFLSTSTSAPLNNCGIFSQIFPFFNLMILSPATTGIVFWLFTHQCSPIDIFIEIQLFTLHQYLGASKPHAFLCWEGTLRWTASVCDCLWSRNFNG